MINSTTFIKIGDRLLNPAQITSVDLEYYDESPSDGSRGVAVGLTDEQTLVFWYEEAEVVRQFFLSGSRTYDLHSFYGERAKQAQIKKP